MTRYHVTTTENAKKPYCIFDKVAGTYVRKADGLIMSYKTFREAQRSLPVMDDPTTTA